MTDFVMLISFGL